MSIRGEVALRVCGRDVSIAPTYRAIEQIETRLGIGIPLLLARAMSGDARVRDIAVCVHEGLKGAGHGGKNGSGDAFTLEQVGEDVICSTASFNAYCTAVGMFLGNALGGTEKKVDAPPDRS